MLSLAACKFPLSERWKPQKEGFIVVSKFSTRTCSKFESLHYNIELKMGRLTGGGAYKWLPRVNKYKQIKASKVKQIKQSKLK